MQNNKKVYDYDTEGRGKPCPKCKSPLVELSGAGGSKICCNGKCGYVIENWPLDEGQKYIL